MKRFSLASTSLFLVLTLCIASGSRHAHAAEAPEKTPAAGPFLLTNVLTVHLTFTAEQWEAMEPKGGPANLFGGPGPRGSGGPGGPGRGGGGGFGPGMFLAPAFLSQADQNRDALVSAEEFSSLASRWFASWDKEKKGSLNGDQIRTGLNSTLGNAGPRMNLQGPEGKKNGLASAMGIEFQYVHAELDFAGRTFKDVGVRYKGNGTFLQSRASNKRSLKVELNRYLKDQKYGKITTLNLHNCVTDASWMNEVLSHRLYRDAGVAAPRTGYARVYVTVPGKYDRTYLGLYSLVEDVDAVFGERAFHVKKGTIYKPVTPDLFSYLGEDWARYKQTYDPKGDSSEFDHRRVIEFSKLVSDATDEEFAGKVGDFLDLEQFSRYMAVTVWLSTMDSILSVGQNYYVYVHPETHKFQFIPWDLDHSFGQFPLMGTQEQREKLSIHKPWQGEKRFLDRVFKTEAFKKAYLAHLDEFSKTLFMPERLSAQVDAVASAIRSAIKEESGEKLARFDKVVAGEPIEPAGFGGPPGGAGGPGFFRPSVKPIKGFVTARFDAVNDQLAGKSKGETMEGFGPGRGPGGPGGPPGNFGPGNFIGPIMLKDLDTNKDGKVSAEEFSQGFTRWFHAWDTGNSGRLTEEQLRDGLNKQFSAFPGPPPQGASEAP